MNMWKMTCIAGAMIIGTGMGILACGGGSCGEATDSTASTSGALTTADNCQDGGLNASQAAAVSLTNALVANNPSAVTIEGDFPGETSEATDQGEVSASPGGTITLSTRASNPEDPDDPIVASLVWMEGSGSFISLPASGADSDDDDTLQNSFTVDQSVCDNLCDIVHQVKCYEAAQTASGTITAANLTTVVLECTGAGNPAQCPSVQNILTAPVTNCQQACQYLTTCLGTNDLSDCIAACTVDPQKNQKLSCWSTVSPQGCNDLVGLEQCVDNLGLNN